MKFSCFLSLLFSFSAFAQLRVVPPTATEISSFDLREGELYTSDDAKTLFLHTSSEEIKINNPHKIAFLKDVQAASTNGGVCTVCNV